MSAKDELIYLPLGGAGEIGMNCYLYGYGPEADRRWIMIDCGVTFADMASAPGVDLVLPDVDFIAERRDKLEAIFITHAHEDHVGAIGRLWRRLRAPIYATRFTAEIAKRKLEEAGLPDKHLRVVAAHEPQKVGPFEASFFPVTHSIPDANALIIRSPAATVFHTGDFKFDDTPVLGHPIDEAALSALGDAGVDVVACDSTNVLENGSSRSEAVLRPSLEQVIRGASGAVAATTFASNVARLKTLAEIAVACDRSVVLAGRAMKRMIEAAVLTGEVADFPALLPEDQAADLPAEHVFYLVTGSQGEGRAAMARIANGAHPTVSLGEGDLVIYSSSTIPGNEREVHRMYNKLSERGVDVVDLDLADVHVSGHAKSDELQRLYRALKPTYALPLHGEHRHLTAHAKKALEWGVEGAIVAPNGSMVRLARGGSPAEPEVVEQVETGRVYVDGAAHVGALDGVMRARLRLARQGHVSISLVVDEEGELIADPVVRAMGLPLVGDDWPAPLAELIEEAVAEAVDKLKPRDRETDTQLEDVAHAACRRICDRHWRKKPEVSVAVIRLEEEDDE